MKTNFLTRLIILFTLVTSQQMLAQNVFPEPGPGNVGIGTMTPNHHLEIKFPNSTISLGEGQKGPHKIMFGDIPNEGMNIHYNTTMNQLRFEKIDGSPQFFVDSDNGNGYFRSNLGIGTFSPKANLDVYSTKNPQIRLSTPSSYLQLGMATSNAQFSSAALTGDAVIRVLGKGQNLIFDTGSSAKGGESFIFVGAGTPIMTITDDKTVDLNADLNISADKEIFFQKNGQIKSKDKNHRIIFDTDANIMELREYGDIVFSSGSLNGSATNKMIVQKDGNVGIGTVATKYKLEVCGIIRSKEVRVASGWCDYVFDDNYRLPSLEEESQFISENGHLSTFESEEAMNGEINVGDVTKRQQETIEQLMLHVIELNEQAKTMNAEMKALKAQVEAGK